MEKTVKLQWNAQRGSVQKRQNKGRPPEALFGLRTLPMTPAKAVFIYILGGIVGTVYETALNFVRGDGFVYCNGSLFTLFNPVYGFGAIVIVAALGQYKSPLAIFGVGTLMGAAVEYLLSLLEEAFLGTRSWDYSDLPLNINGRITVPIALGWGLICLIVICGIFGAYNQVLSMIPKRIFSVVAIVVFCLLLVDFSCTAVVLFRYTDRMQGTAPQNRVEQFIDRHFNDEFMRQRFPQMEKNKQKRTEQQSPENETSEARNFAAKESGEANPYGTVRIYCSSAFRKEPLAGGANRYARSVYRNAAISCVRPRGRSGLCPSICLSI